MHAYMYVYMYIYTYAYLSSSGGYTELYPPKRPCISLHLQHDVNALPVLLPQSSLHICVYISPWSVRRNEGRQHTFFPHIITTPSVHTQKVFFWAVDSVCKVLSWAMCWASHSIRAICPQQIGTATNRHCNKSVLQKIGTALRVDRPFC